MRRRAPSALAAIGGFGVAVAGLSVAATASIVLLMPDPPAVRMTVAEAAAALRGRPGTLDRREGAPPSGPPVPLLAGALAGALGRPSSSVRVVWLDPVPRRVPGRVVLLPGGAGIGIPPARVIVGRDGAPLKREGVVIRFRQSGTLPAIVGPGRGVIDQIVAALPQPAFAASVRLADGRWLTVAPHRAFLGGWRLKVLAALAVSLLLLAPLAWLFARRLTRPFRALAAAIETGGEPPPAHGPRELREAAAAITQLRARLAADAEERMRMLVAVAHDLRTPLTSLKLRIESVPEPQRRRMVADADRMGAMIGDVLAFARVADAARAVVPVRPLVAAVLADLPEAAVTLVPGGEPRVAVVPEAFRRAIENLVRNAVDHAGGGRIEVTEAAGEAIVAIVDRGPGIAPGDRARLVRPFERGEASRSRDTGGIGLGLSIVQSFADLHGGTLALGDGPGGGARVVLRLPAA